ncbi:MAG: hypothetical protein GWN30_19260 [Gammaproteobacteria bacterium]|nr:hypothetical protein [Gammaproteobacteria bacterium]NIW99424.1 hypothetical protein [Phycisphaerae bacterium]
MKNLDFQTAKFLQNPVWYIATVAVLALLTSYVYLPWWFAGLVALVWGGWLVQQLFRQDGPQTNDEIQLTAYLEQALAYKAQIHQVIETAEHKSHHLHLGQLKTQLDICINAVETLVQRLTLLHQDNLIHNDVVAVPKAIANLEHRLVCETNQAIVTQLKYVLTIRKNQLDLLERLEITAKQTELQIEHTISLLGTIYSQLLIGQSTNVMADYSRLSANIDEEVKRLEDHLEALQEVKGGLLLGQKNTNQP